jgi:acyl phosphate:glycerol-3-phosphate acyltransferase
VSTLGPLLLAYALGCISFAALAGRLKGVDVRKHGSGNPGATNVGRLLGRGWGRTVLALDMLKGLLPVAFLAVPPSALDSGGHVPVALAVVVGHVWPVTSGFRGGKGVATFVGAALALEWRAALSALLVHVAVKRGTGYVSVASVAMAWAFPALLAAGRLLAPGVDLSGRAAAPDAPWSDGLALLCLLAAVVTLRHAGNFVRIRNGTEHRAGQSVPLERLDKS